MQNTWTIEAFVKFSRMKKSWIKWIKYKIYVSQSTNNYKIPNTKYNNENFSSKRTIHFHLGKIQLERIPESMISTLPPSTWSKARSLRSQPVARYLLNHNTASRAKKKRKKKTKQAIKEQRRLRAIPFNESTPCSREGRHSSSLASLNADNGREIGEITPENHPRFHAHGPTAHLYSLSFRSVRCVALFPPYDRSVKHKWSRRTKNGCWRQWITSFRRTYRFDEILRQSPLASSM